MPQHLHERPRRPSQPLDDASARRAQIRAIAAGLVDGPRMGRRFHVPDGVPLRPSPRLRLRGRRPRGVATTRQSRVGWTRRRWLSVGFLLVQVGIFVALMMSPAFKVHAVDVSGDHLVSRDVVLAAARVSPSTSLFTVDGDAIRSRIAAIPWVRSATVTTQLPSTVHISVVEWQPDVLLRHASTSAFVAANGATLPFTQSTESARKGIPLLLDYRPGSQQPLPDGFAELLGSAAQRWPSTFGCNVDAFALSNADVLTVWCSTGWQAVFGAIDGSEAVAAIPGQLEVLAALKGRLDFVHPAFGYIDLENPSAPAIGGTPGESPALRADIAGAALPTAQPPTAASVVPQVAASPTASPTPRPSPTPKPSPTPFTFTLTPPTPGARR
jgi:cell division septal protein FtsQ